MSERAWKPKEVVSTQREGPRWRGFGLASPCTQLARPSRCSTPSQPKPAPRRQRSRREEAGARPALAARGHRGNYTLHCSSLQTVTNSPAHRSRGSSLLLRISPSLNCWLHLSERTRESRPRPTASGDLPGFLTRCEYPLHPRSPRQALRSLQRIPPAPQPWMQVSWSRKLKDRNLLHALQNLHSCVLPLNTTPSQCNHPSTPNSGTASVSKVSPASRRCTFLSPTRYLNHLPETSEAFALSRGLCCAQTAPLQSPTVYPVPEVAFEAVDKNSGFGLRAFFPTNCMI